MKTRPLSTTPIAVGDSAGDSVCHYQLDTAVEIETRRLSTTCGYWRVLADRCIIISEMRGTRDEHIIAEFSDDEQALAAATFITAFQQDWPTLLDPFLSRFDRERFWRFNDGYHVVQKGLAGRPVRILKHENLAALEANSGPWIAVHQGGGEHITADFDFFSNALDDAASLIYARAGALMAWVDADGGNERIAIDRADATLVAGRKWGRDQFSGRIWDGHQCLDQLFIPHNELTHSVTHLNGDLCDFRRHNLRRDYCAAKRTIELKPEIWARLDHCGKSVGQILADVVGVRH